MNECATRSRLNISISSPHDRSYQDLMHKHRTTNTRQKTTTSDQSDPESRSHSLPGTGKRRVWGIHTDLHSLFLKDKTVTEFMSSFIRQKREMSKRFISAFRMTAMFPSLSFWKQSWILRSQREEHERLCVVQLMCLRNKNVHLIKHVKIKFQPKIKITRKLYFAYL